MQAKSVSASPQEQEMQSYTPLAANWVTNNNLMRSMSEAQVVQRQKESSKEMEPIQAKLTIGQVGDKYEQEADQTAQQVVNQINAPAPQQLAQGQSLQFSKEELQMPHQSDSGGMAANVLEAKVAKREPALVDDTISISQVATKSPIQRIQSTEDENLLDQPIPEALNLDPVLSPESFVEPINEEMNTTFLKNRRMEREAELTKMNGGASRTKDRAKGVVSLEKLKKRPQSNLKEEQGQAQYAPQMDTNDQGSYLSTPLLDEYRNEYNSGKTYYPDSLDPYKLDISEGKLKQSEKEVDTIKSRRLVKTEGSKNGRFIYTMDSKGEFTVGDEYAENKKHEQEFHHSSLRQGDDAAGAGELQVRDGKLEVISDRSGHYEPTSALTHQVVKNLESKGVAMEGVGIELEKKGRGQGNLNLSALEFLAYEPEMNQAIEAYKKFEAENPQADDKLKEATKRKLLNAPENKIRESHKKKHSMLDELKAKTAGRKTDYDKMAVEGTGQTLPKTTALKKCFDEINKTLRPQMQANRLERVLLPDADPPATEDEQKALTTVSKDNPTLLAQATQEAITIDDFLTEIGEYMGFQKFRRKKKISKHDYTL